MHYVQLVDFSLAVVDAARFAVMQDTLVFGQGCLGFSSFYGPWQID